MEHGPAAEWSEDRSESYKKRIGFYFFLGYAIVYAGFIVINTIWPKTMEARVVFGLNLAVFYGFGLILLAIIAGLVYNLLCGRKEREMNEGGEA
ncbi:MAG TPA: DUF485 domain-containing protein [Spirochaetia bacterium]|nr:DUF485 domain-containing protein [Spirochaetia bacterium]